jgi:hypothetical protein
MTRTQNTRLGLWLLVAGALALGSLNFAGRGVADEKIGTVRQGLVGGKEIDEKTQEYYGLLKFDMGTGTCSASLLRNDWAISAAHCVDAKDAKGNTTPDPNRPGQNVMRPIGKFKLTAAWGGGQTRNAVRVETFWPYDISLIQLDSPFTVNGKNTGYVREVFFDQFPYFGTPTTATIKVFGAGINQFATGSGDSAMPSSSDDKYRMGTSRVERVEPNGTLYWYRADGDNMIAGGDSGGPSFATVGTNQTTVLVGVHALTIPNYIEGKSTKGWKWVTSTPEAADAPIKPVWDKIQNIMGPLPQAPPPPPEPFTGRHKAVFEEGGFFTGGGKVEENILYGVAPDGGLIWHKHYIDQRGGKVRHTFAPTKRVGDGWKAGYKGAFPAGQNGIYTLADNGELRLHWHIGAFDGSYKWREPSIVVGTGWTMFDKIISMDQGVIYGILPNTITREDGKSYPGILRWHKNTHYADTSSSPNNWRSAKDVGWEWGHFKQVFSGGNGVLYTVGQDGKLLWYKHKTYKSQPASIPLFTASKGAKDAWNNTWAGPKRVGDGWGEFTKIFSPGEGHIYGIMPNGDLMYYRHTGWQDGSYVWDENLKGKIATGWNGYSSAFARIITSDPEPKGPN